MMVAPEVIQLPEVEIAAGGRVGGNRSSTRGVEPTVTAAGVREYVAGDSLRWIHWPTTARQDELYVHQYDAEPSSDWWVILDMDPGVHIGGGRVSTEECAAILAASIVNRGLLGNKAVGLVSQGEELVWHPPRAGTAQLYEVLRSLALLRPGGLRLGQLLGKVNRSLDQNSSLIIVTPSLSMEWTAALASLMRSGIVPTVILLDPNSFGGSGDLEAMRRRLSQMNIKHYTFTADLLGPLEDQEDEERDWWMLYRPRDAAGARSKNFWRALRRNLSKIGLMLLFYMGLISAIGGAVRGVEDRLLWTVVGWGLFTGWSFSRRPLLRWMLVPLNFILGMGLMFLEVLNLGERIKSLASIIPTYVPSIYIWIFNAEPLDLKPLTGIANEIWLDISQFGGRIWEWMASTMRGESYYDPVMVVLFWGGVLWGFSAWALWRMQTRRDPLLALFPSVLLGGLTIGTTGDFSMGLLLMLASLLTLVILSDRDMKRKVWEEQELFQDADIAPRILRVGTLLAVGITIGAWLFSFLSVETFSDLFDPGGSSGSQEFEIARSLGLERKEDTEAGQAFDPFMDVQLPNEHLIGAPPELSEEVVMYLTIEGVSSGQEGLREEVTLPRYVRSLSYDRYTGRGWASRSVEVLEYEPGELILEASREDQAVLRQRVLPVGDPPGHLYTIGIPLRVDQGTSIAWRLHEEDSGRVDLFGGILSVREYRADSIIPRFNEERVRASGQRYPTWIEERYLPLPSTIPEKVLTLARDLTAVEPTPYDRAVALERYLRTYPYTLEVPTPPIDEDITEFFLYTLREGYCDYYATTMVVLARAAGLPARLVTGYLMESDTPAGSEVAITADQAHAWVEIYFPELGWIPFEPTAGRPEIPREEPDQTLALPELDLSLEPLVVGAPDRFSRLLRGLGIAAAGLLSISLITALLMEWRFQRQETDLLLPAIVSRVYSFGQAAGVDTRAGDSSSEYFDRLCRNFLRPIAAGRRSKILDETLDLMRQLDQEYKEYLFDASARISQQRSSILACYVGLRKRFLAFWLMAQIARIPIIKFIFRTGSSQPGRL
jgi:transglutaminase-like putative cysteine protease